MIWGSTIFFREIAILLTNASYDYFIPSLKHTFLNHMLFAICAAFAYLLVVMREGFAEQFYGDHARRS